MKLILVGLLPETNATSERVQCSEKGCGIHVSENYYVPRLALARPQGNDCFPERPVPGDRDDKHVCGLCF